MPLEEDVRKLISKQIGIDESEVVDEASLVENLGADSLDTVELVIQAKEKFGIEISDEDAEKLLMVKDVIDSITSLGPLLWLQKQDK